MTHSVDVFANDIDMKVVAVVVVVVVISEVEVYQKKLMLWSAWVKIVHLAGSFKVSSSWMLTFINKMSQKRDEAIKKIEVSKS